MKIKIGENNEYVVENRDENKDRDVSNEIFC
jgi:hypothetical protein